MSSVEKNQYIWQRRVIGIMVLALSPLSVLFGLIGINHNPAGWWYSISDTYYANSQVIMISIISIAAFFFCTYAGYDWRDRVVNIISGVGLFGLLFFPCGNEGVIAEGKLVGLFCIKPEISTYIHSAFAILAFAGFFFNEMFIFTLGNNEKSEGKKRRNLIYRICASTVLIALVLIILNAFPVINKEIPNLIWISEFISLTGACIAWLVKGKALKILND